MRLPLLLACAVASASCAYSQTGDTASAVASPPAATDGALQIARNGNEVILAWELPAGKMRQVELMRNSSSQAMGRGRVAAVRAETTLYIDEVPDLTVIYWQPSRNRSASNNPSCVDSGQAAAQACTKHPEACSGH